MSADLGLPRQSLPRLHSQWRPSIFEWFYKIIDHFLLDRGIVAIAMDYVDRFLLTSAYLSLSDNTVEETTSNERCADRVSIKTYQLVAMSSLYIAMKLHGGNETGSTSSPWRIKRRTFCIKGFVRLSRGQFQPKDVLSMEVIILQALQWKVNPVTVSCFLDAFMDLFPKPEEVLRSLHGENDHRIDSRSRKHLRMAVHVLHELGRYLVELAICIPGLTPYFETQYSGECINQAAPSAISYAAILLAMDMMTLSAIPYLARDIFTARVTQTQKAILERTSSRQDNQMKYMQYDPFQQEILKIKALILGSFVPSLILGPLSGEEGTDDSTPYHPFQIAKQAGMFNMGYFKNEDEPQPPSPTSPIEGDLI